MMFCNPHLNLVSMTDCAGFAEALEEFKGERAAASLVLCSSALMSPDTAHIRTQGISLGSPRIGTQETEIVGLHLVPVICIHLRSSSAMAVPWLFSCGAGELHNHGKEQEWL